MNFPFQRSQRGKVARPTARWFGGKWHIAPWVESFFPEHRIYVEPFGGAASVLMYKEPCHTEVYNDMDEEVVNLFRVLRNPKQAKNLARMIELTPYSRKEFEDACRSAGNENPVESARLLLVRSYMGFSSDSHSRMRRCGFRSRGSRMTQSVAADWESWPKYVGSFTKRLKKVIIEKMDVLKIIEKYDEDGVLFYMDPPYLAETRSPRTGRYTHEFKTEEQHILLAESLHKVKAAVILSGYESDLYKKLYEGWRIERRISNTTFNKKSVEVLWINKVAKLMNLHLPLY